MFKKHLFLYFFACTCASTVLAATNPEPKIVNPKDQTDVYGIPTDMDEVEESQEIQDISKQNK